MLSLRKIFSEAEEKDKVENFTHFEKDAFFEKTLSPEYFEFFDRKEAFNEA
jgi:hypothetical protein